MDTSIPAMIWPAWVLGRRTRAELGRQFETDRNAERPGEVFLLMARWWTWPAAVALLVFCASCSRTEWTDNAPTVNTGGSADPGLGPQMRLFKGRAGATAGAMEIEAKHGTMGRNLHDSAAARLERFREYWGGPPVVEGRGFLVARAQKKAEHLVVVCLPWATHPLWVMLELRDGSRWAERTSDLLSRHLQADISARDLLDAAPVAVPKGNAWFVTRTMGTVALPAAWFDGFETLPGGPDALDYKSPWLVLRGLSGYVDVFDTANKKNLLAQMGYKGWRNVKSVELREGVNRLPQSAQGGDAPYVKLWNGTDWKAMGLEEHRVPPRPKTVRAWIVKRGSRFVAVIEHGGPIRNAETSTEALVRFFDGELLRALK